MNHKIIYLFMLLCVVVALPIALQADYQWDQDIQSNISRAAEQNRDAVAVVIGNQTYDHPDVPPVNYALQDAKLIKQYLIKTLGYREGNILYEENIGKETFEVIFGTKENYEGKLYDYIKPGKSDVFIYYSGHGIADRDKQGYFAPRGIDPSKIKLGGYPTSVFYTNLTKLPARSVTVAIDACFSGLVNSASPVFIEVENPIIAANNISVLTSSQGNQLSSWYDEKKHGLFTFFLANALRGHADKNEDQKLTIQEIYDYVSNRNEGVPYYARRLHGRQQTPILAGRNNAFVLTTLKQPPPDAPPPVRFWGHVQVNVNVDQAKVYFDNILMGTAGKNNPLQKSNIESGQITIRVEADEYKSQSQMVTVKADQWIQPVFKLEAKNPVQGKTLVKKGIEFVYVPGGTFEMGDLWGDGYDNEKPVHTVELDGFYMGKYQVTNAQYAQFLNEYGSDTVKEGEYKGKTMIDEHQWGVQKDGNQWQPANGYANHPVVYVTWYGAYEFCRYYGFQLPTEAQWEYAARSGGKKEKWSGTSDENELTNYAWYGKNSGSKTHPVGEKQPNGLGLYDMSGNVWEWCQDWYDGAYYQKLSNKVSKNPVNTNGSDARVLRGGSWYRSPRYCRVANRCRRNPDDRNGNGGFRVVCFVAVSRTP